MMEMIDRDLGVAVDQRRCRTGVADAIFWPTGL